MTETIRVATTQEMLDALPRLDQIRTTMTLAPEISGNTNYLRTLVSRWCCDRKSLFHFNVGTVVENSQPVAIITRIA